MGYQFDPLVQYETYIHNINSSFPTIPSPPQATFINEPKLLTPDAEVIPPPSLTSAEKDQPMIEVSVSTAFHPGSHPDPSDLVFYTTDFVLFYVNARTIQKSSKDAFSCILHAPITSPKLYQKVINVPDTSDILNVILHCLYGTSFTQNSPTFNTLEAAIDRMPFYSITPSKHIFSGTPLYNYILSLVALHPVRLYALAAHHNLEDLAVVSSSHLLGVPLLSIRDDMAVRMGALYFNRLLHLLLPRIEMLKNILLTPPMSHPATQLCTLEDQKRVTRAWALAVAYLAWEVRPDLSTYNIRAALNPVLEDLSCEVCVEGLKNQIKRVVVEWANAKRTI